MASFCSGRCRGAVAKPEVSMRRLRYLISRCGVGCALALVMTCKTTRQVVTDRAPETVHLTIVGTNDVHGWVMTQHETFSQGEIRFGGVAPFAAYLKILRDDNPGGVVLVDGGDLFQGTLMSNVTEGAVVIEAFNLLGYDAAAIGNHEFDYGPVGAVSAVQMGMDPFGALRMRINQARFPLLSTNIYEMSSGLRPTWLPGDGTTLIERRGVKVGIVGLTTPQTPTTTLPINVATLKFKALPAEAITAAHRLRERGADVVIAAIHAGGKCVDNVHHHDTSTCDTDSGEVFEMMSNVPAGTFDAIVAGHTHAQISHFVNGTPIIESWALGRYFGVIDLHLDPVTKKVLTEKTEITSGLEICETYDAATRSCDIKKLKRREAEVRPVQAQFRGRPIVPDPELTAALEPARRQVAELQERDLGIQLRHSLGRNYEDESALGSFLADSLREMCHADVAMLNPGGLRADLREGALKYGAVYEVLPFDNSVATLDVTGEQLRRLLTAAYGARKGVFQISGLTVKLARCPTANRLREVTVNGHALEPRSRYRVVMPDFLARGGDGLASVLATIEPRQVDLGENRGSNLRDELVTWWQEQKREMEAPKAGRVEFLSDGSECSAAAKVDVHVGAP